MEDLISKRELLERYGVSYGALYRWKRMGLIPEDWFLRRATPTGQETFFHRAQICPRVEQILQRGDTSLEDLAEKLREPERHAPENWLIVTDRFTSRRFRLEELKSITLIVDGQAQDVYKRQSSSSSAFAVSSFAGLRPASTIAEVFPSSLQIAFPIPLWPPVTTVMAFFM